MNLSKLIAVFALLVASATPAMATTSCTSTLASVQSEAGTGSTNLFVVLTSGSWFYLPSTDPMFKTVAAAAYLALTTQASVTVVFTASGVSCSSSGSRTDMILFVNNAS